MLLRPHRATSPQRAETHVTRLDLDESDDNVDQLGGRLPLPELLEAHLRMVQQLPGQPLAAEHAAVNQGLQPANYRSARSHAQPDVLLSPTGSDSKTADSEPGDKQWRSLGSALDPEQSVSSDSAGSATPSSEHNSSPPAQRSLCSSAQTGSSNIKMS